MKRSISDMNPSGSGSGYDVESDSKTPKVEQPHMSNDEIIQIVKEIQNNTMGVEEKQKFFKDKYPIFQEMYPILFEMASSQNMDWNHFNYIMRMREKIMTNKKSVDDVSKDVGQKFFDIYVKDKLEKS